MEKLAVVPLKTYVYKGNNWKDMKQGNIVYIGNLNHVPLAERIVSAITMVDVRTGEVGLVLINGESFKTSWQFVHVKVSTKEWTNQLEYSKFSSKLYYHRIKNIGEQEFKSQIS